MIWFSGRNLIVAAALSTAVLTVGAGSLVGQSASEKEPRKQGSVTTQSTETPKSDPAAVALAMVAERQAIRKIVETSKQRLDAQRRYYEEGRITIDRYLDALSQLKAWETEFATNRLERVAAAEHHLERVRDVEAREILEMDAGRGTAADVAEAKLARDRAELDLLRATTFDAPDVRDLEKRIEALERKLETALKMLERKGMLSR